MGSISKHSLNSETSGEESDQPEKLKEVNTGVGRFYECNFCKRGFTNAQALGGHMNIHRKDRAKAKQKKSSKSSFSNKSGEECMKPRYSDHLSSDYQQYFAVPMGEQMNRQFYVPTSNPNFSLGYDHRHHLSDSVTLRTEHLSLFEDHKTAKLIMQIDHYSDHEEDSESRNTNWKENELDLELRLG